MVSSVCDFFSILDADGLVPCAGRRTYRYGMRGITHFHTAMFASCCASGVAVDMMTFFVVFDEKGAEREGERTLLG